MMEYRSDGFKGIVSNLIKGFFDYLQPANMMIAIPAQYSITPLFQMKPTKERTIYFRLVLEIPKR